MGIRGLWQSVKKYSGRVSTEKFDYIIIDGTMMVINFSMPIRHLEGSMFEEVLRKIFTIRVHRLIDRLTVADASKLIFVFDPLEKPAEKIRPRQKLEGLPDMSFDYFYDLMHESHVSIVESDIEADHKMAEIYERLVGEGQSPIVYTEDSDLLCLVPAVMRFDFSVYKVSEIIAGLGVTKKKFIDACVMAANDYNDSTMTFSKALKMV